MVGTGRYGTSADMWSLGVVLYILLSGSFPFLDDENLFHQIQNAQYSVSGPEWSGISDSAKNMVRSLLTLRPDQRIPVQEAIIHPWIKGQDTMKTSSEINLEPPYSSEGACIGAETRSNATVSTKNSIIGTRKKSVGNSATKSQLASSSPGPGSSSIPGRVTRTSSGLETKSKQKSKQKSSSIVPQLHLTVQSSASASSSSSAPLPASRSPFGSCSWSHRNSQHSQSYSQSQSQGNSYNSQSNFSPYGGSFINSAPIDLKSEDILITLPVDSVQSKSGGISLFRMATGVGTKLRAGESEPDSMHPSSLIPIGGKSIMTGGEKVRKVESTTVGGLKQRNLKIENEKKRARIKKDEAVINGHDDLSRASNVIKLSHPSENNLFSHVRSGNETKLKTNDSNAKALELDSTIESLILSHSKHSHSTKDRHDFLSNENHRDARKIKDDSIKMRRIRSTENTTITPKIFPPVLDASGLKTDSSLSSLPRSHLDVIINSNIYSSVGKCPINSGISAVDAMELSDDGIEEFHSDHDEIKNDEEKDDQEGKEKEKGKRKEKEIEKEVDVQVGEKEFEVEGNNDNDNDNGLKNKLDNSSTEMMIEGGKLEYVQNPSMADVISFGTLSLSNSLSPAADIIDRTNGNICDDDRNTTKESTCNCEDKEIIDVTTNNTEYTGMTKVKARKCFSKIAKNIPTKNTRSPYSLSSPLSQQLSAESMRAGNDRLDLISSPVTPTVSSSRSSSTISSKCNTGGSSGRGVKRSSKSPARSPSCNFKIENHGQRPEGDGEEGVGVSEGEELDRLSGSPRRKIRAITCRDSDRPTAAPSSTASASAPTSSSSSSSSSSSRSATKRNTASTGVRGSTGPIQGTLEEAWGRSKISFGDITSSTLDDSFGHLQRSRSSSTSNIQGGKSCVSTTADVTARDKKTLSKKEIITPTERKKDIRKHNSSHLITSTSTSTSNLIQTVGIANVTAGRRKLRVTMKSLVDIFQPTLSHSNRK